MTKYDELINKIRTIKVSQELEGNPYPNYNAGILNQDELTLIADALETIQFLEIIFKAREQSFSEVKEKLENHE
jgi:hypothetical protein